jgi:hypothetical protein
MTSRNEVEDRPLPRWRAPLKALKRTSFFFASFWRFLIGGSLVGMQSKDSLRNVFLPLFLLSSDWRFELLNAACFRRFFNFQWGLVENNWIWLFLKGNYWLTSIFIPRKDLIALKYINPKLQSHHSNSCTLNLDSIHTSLYIQPRTIKDQPKSLGCSLVDVSQVPESEAEEVGPRFLLWWLWS